MSCFLSYNVTLTGDCSNTSSGEFSIDIFGSAPDYTIQWISPPLGTIALDEHTHLLGIPDSAWLYKLGNRSALEWVLDQYKEKKPKDKTIAEKFNTYRFADYKSHVTDLLKRVCTVSVETMKIIEEMNK
jgi:predicted helicase